MLTIDAAALDQAADALRTAGQYLTTADGRRSIGPSVGPDTYRHQIILALERLMSGEPIRASDEKVIAQSPEDTWP